jgi:sugar-specific transcriptional regulator TrmB
MHVLSPFIEEKMLLSSKEEEVLNNLGLTASQAKVYLALIQNGPSKVAAIAYTASISREHLYEILKSLERAGLVERELGKTTIYKAAPLDGALPMLFKNKQLEISELENKIKSIIESYEKEKTAEPAYSRKAKPEITLTANKIRTLNKGQSFFENAKSQIAVMHTWKRFLQFWNYYEETITKAMNRGVRFLELVELPPDANQAGNFFTKKVFTNEMFELRFASEIGGNFGLIDRERMFMSSTQGKENLAQTPMIFSNYEGFLTILQNYFQTSWKSAYKWKSTMEISEILAQHRAKRQECVESAAF